MQTTDIRHIAASLGIRFVDFGNGQIAWIGTQSQMIAFARATKVLREAERKKGAPQ